MAKKPPPPPSLPAGPYVVGPAGSAAVGEIAGRALGPEYWEDVSQPWLSLFEGAVVGFSGPVGIPYTIATYPQRDPTEAFTYSLGVFLGGVGRSYAMGALDPAASSTPGTDSHGFDFTVNEQQYTAPIGPEPPGAEFPSTEWFIEEGHGVLDDFIQRPFDILNSPNDPYLGIEVDPDLVVPLLEGATNIWMEWQGYGPLFPF